MKKYIISIFMMLASATSSFAQSSMTDQAVMEYVIEEHQKGTSQSQIVTQLIQKGVTIDQIRRVKKKYEKETGNEALGAKNLTTTPGKEDRTRKNNGDIKTGKDRNVSKYRVKDGKIKPQTTHTFDEEDKDYLLMQRELNTFMPDSDEIYDRKYLEMMM